MKLAQSFAVVRNTYWSGYRVIAITTDKVGRAWGRNVADDQPTNVASREILARFPTQAEAEIAVIRANEAYSAHTGLVQTTERAHKDARAARDQATLDAVRGVQTQTGHVPTRIPQTEPTRSTGVQDRACNKP